MHWNTPLNFSTLTHALFLWVLWRFPLYLRRISRFFHPSQLGTYTYPLGTFSTPTPYGTLIFHLEHPPQVQTAVVGWNYMLTVLLGKFKFFHPKNSSLSILTFQFLHLTCPNIKNTKRNYYQGITKYRVSNLTKPINLKCLKL